MNKTFVALIIFFFLTSDLETLNVKEITFTTFRCKTNLAFGSLVAQIRAAIFRAAQSSMGVNCTELHCTSWQ